MADSAELEEEVKITIIASGFGMNNIPGMEQAIRERQQRETTISERERLEREEKDREMVEKFYGRSKLAQKRVVRTFILQDADLDNDTLISSIESSPTWRRTSAELSELEASARTAASPEPADTTSAESASATPDTTSGFITF